MAASYEDLSSHVGLPDAAAASIDRTASFVRPPSASSCFKVNDEIIAGVLEYKRGSSSIIQRRRHFSFVSFVSVRRSAECRGGGAIPQYVSRDRKSPLALFAAYSAAKYSPFLLRRLRARRPTTARAQSTGVVTDVFIGCSRGALANGRAQ
jgi:hypothetical protein